MNTRAEFPYVDDPEIVNKPWVRIDDTYWGCIIRSYAGTHSASHIIRWLSGFVGLALVFAALGFWVLPGSLLSADIMVMKFASSASLCMSGFLFLWFSSQQTRREVHIDRARGELREALRNSRGNAFMLRRYAFEDIGSVFLERSTRQKSVARLLLRYKNTSQVIVIATADEKKLTELRDRLAHDILGVSKPAARAQVKRKPMPVNMRQFNVVTPTRVM